MANELADRIIPLYERYAAEWDRDRNTASSWNDRCWIERFASDLPLGATVLDLGCGPGEPIARYLAEHGFRLTGVDGSPSMIALSRKRLPDHEWIVGDMRKADVRRRFDGILAWDSYFFLPPEDQARMFEVFAAHAKVSTVLMFNSGPAHGEAIGEYRGEPLYHASLHPDEYRALLARHGFAVVEHVVEDRRAGGRTVWLARRSGENNS